MHQDEISRRIKDKGKKEREALTGLLSKYMKETDQYRYHIYHTPNRDKSKYDCIVKKYQKSDSRLVKKMFFEVKIRGAHYDTLLLEKQKLESLKSLITNKETDSIYYVNFTPVNTVMFDLLSIEDKLHFVNEKHNRVSVNKEAGKREKAIAYISIYDGKIYDYVYVDKDNLVDNLADNSLLEPNIEPEKNEQPAEPEQNETANNITNNITDLLENVEITENETEQTEQTELDLKPQKQYDGIRRDEKGIILYDSIEEFRSFPLKIQWLCVAQHRIKLFLRPDEDRDFMVELMGGEMQLADFLHKRLTNSLFKNNDIV